MSNSQERQMQLCSDFFDQADTDGSGCLSKLELAKIVRQMTGNKKSIDEMVEMFQGCDKNNDDRITKEEFMNEMVKRPASEIDECDIRDAFKKFDKDGSGSVSASELGALLTSGGYNCTSDDVDRIMKEADSSGDGQISFDEFYAAWTK